MCGVGHLQYEQYSQFPFSQYQSTITFTWGTQWYTWLRDCVTSQKVAGSIPNGIRIFHRLNPPGSITTQGSTQPLTEMSTRNISCGGKGSRCMWRLCGKLGTSTPRKTQGLSRPAQGLLYHKFYLH
jgi:hypothetical protein